MTKRAETRPNAPGGSPATAPLTDVLGPLVAGMTATRQSWLAWVHTVGWKALDAVFHEEAATLAGPKGRHDPGRTPHHWGRPARALTFGGRRLSVPCPRVRSTDGRDATLPSVAALRHRDPLTTRVMEQLLLGMSARGYARSLEGAGVGGRSRGNRKSAVSRVVVARTPAHLATPLERRLEGLDLLALFMDGMVVAGQTVIVAQGVTRMGTKDPLGLCLGSTEHAVVCTQLLQDLLARGLPIDGRVRGVIEGGQGLRKALGDVLGAAAVIPRGPRHTRRTLEARRPKARPAYVRAARRRAARATTATTARRPLTARATGLEHTSHPDAAASLREGLDETLTVVTLGRPLPLRRFVATPNGIEHLIGTLRHGARAVKPWRGGAMIRRWVGRGLLQARARVRRITHHDELAALLTALRADTAAEHAA